MINVRETEGSIKNGQSMESVSNVNTRHKTETNKTKKTHNTICMGHHYRQTNTNNMNKT